MPCPQVRRKAAADGARACKMLEDTVAERDRTIVTLQSKARTHAQSRTHARTHVSTRTHARSFKFLRALARTAAACAGCTRMHAGRAAGGDVVCRGNSGTPNHVLATSAPGLTPTSAPGLTHICTGTRPTYLRRPSPHLRRD